MISRLYVSIGPVQGFVSQSRRTRDLWGSSYLLSFLSAHAIHGAEEAGGRIVRPLVEDDELYRWVKGHREGNPPRVGSVPNHFVAEVDGNAADMAHHARAAIMAAWRRVHEAVRRKFVTPVEASGSGTRNIWDRQVGAFWEIVWAAAPLSNDLGLLARRKHWRDHRPPDEPGDKCTVMHDLQELSGYVRSTGKPSRENQDSFWQDLARHVGPLDLRKNERLCAVALTKRMFPKPGVAKEALGWDVDGSRWPSTVRVAAVPWIGRVEAVAQEAARSYADAVKVHAPEAGDFARLDANWFHRDFVENEDRCQLREAQEHNEVRDGLARMLEDIAKTTDDTTGCPLGAPAKYYALVLADGDHLGKLVNELGGPAVGQALAAFTGTVQSVVADHDGVTVYAGGDDVMAMLPLPTAIQCADELSRRYQKAFADVASTENHATLSAAVAFAHIRYPLSNVIRQAHRLLDDVAKEGNGRASLAVGVFKPGGTYCEWATTWTREGRVRARVELDELAVHFRKVDSNPGLSSSLIYRARKTLAMLCGWDRWEPGTWARVPNRLDVAAFLQAEVARSLAGQGVNEAVATPGHQASEISQSICGLLGRSHADGKTGAGSIGVDALLLARFLADGGQEDDAR